MAIDRTELLESIALLPPGGITYKCIHGKNYAYYQWREDGRQRSRRVQDEELEVLTLKIDERKRLQRLLKELDNAKAAPHAFGLDVRLGENLSRFAEPVAIWRRRSCFEDVRDYIYGAPDDRVLILYGLRRTGKTTLIRQLIAQMDAPMRDKTAFLQANTHTTLAEVNRDLRFLENAGYRYVFLDEATLMEDFVEGAALLSDIFAASGMKIVLSGTDSLGFMFSEDEQLYDRCHMVHTTFIPYREFSGVLGIHGIDRYIQFGGTMSPGGVKYNLARSPFSTDRKTDEYIDSAIARNIQHSLACYQHGGHFRHLRGLYEADELTGAINRVIEDMNHRFTVEVLTRDFASSDLALSAANLRRDREQSSDVLDRIDKDDVTKRLMALLEIRNRQDQHVCIGETHAREIKEYLELLDLTVDIDILTIEGSKVGARAVFTQPGMRYAQAEALVVSLLADPTFNDLAFSERATVVERILTEIKGRMLEDIVLLETKLARPQCRVFKLQFPVGEFDMVVANPVNGACELYEVKHSNRENAHQRRHLLDTHKCADTAFRFGAIEKRCVLYRGAPGEFDGIRYENVEEYLQSL